MNKLSMPVTSSRIFLSLGLACLSFAYQLIKPDITFAAQLQSQPSSITLNQGESKSVDIFLNPQGETIIGADLILEFDPEYIEVNSAVTSGSFSNQIIASVDNIEGQVLMGLANDVGVYLTKASVIATINLTAKKTVTESQLSFVYSPNSTVDTNIATKNGQDALTKVDNLKVKILSISSTTSSNSSTDDANSETQNDSESVTGSVASITDSNEITDVRSSVLRSNQANRTTRLSPTASLSPSPSPTIVQVANTTNPTPVQRNQVLGASHDNSYASLGVNPTWLYMLIALLVTSNLVFGIQLVRTRRLLIPQVNS